MTETVKIYYVTRRFVLPVDVYCEGDVERDEVMKLTPSEFFHHWIDQTDTDERLMTHDWDLEPADVGQEVDDTGDTVELGDPDLPPPQTP